MRGSLTALEVWLVTVCWIGNPAYAQNAPTASSQAVPPISAQKPAEQAATPQVANPPTPSPLAALQQALKKGRQDKSDADLALKAAQNRLERAQQAQRDAKANADELLTRIQSGSDILRGAQARERWTETFYLVEDAKRELPPAQAAQAVAAARVQALEHREQVFLTIGAQCLDPHTPEETRQCLSDFIRANFGSTEDFQAILGAELVLRYNTLGGTEHASIEQEQRDAQQQQEHEREREEQAQPGSAVLVQAQQSKPSEPTPSSVGQSSASQSADASNGQRGPARVLVQAQQSKPSAGSWLARGVYIAFGALFVVAVRYRVFGLVIPGDRRRRRW